MTSLPDTHALPNLWFSFLFHLDILVLSVSCITDFYPGNPYWRGRISTTDLIVLTSSDQLLLKLICFVFFYKTSCLNEEVNCTDPSHSVKHSLLHPSNLTAWLAWASVLHSTPLQSDPDKVIPGNTKGGRITVLLTSCLTGLD